MPTKRDVFSTVVLIAAAALWLYLINADLMNRAVSNHEVLQRSVGKGLIIMIPAMLIAMAPHFLKLKPSKSKQSHRKFSGSVTMPGGKKLHD